MGLPLGELQGRSAMPLLFHEMHASTHTILFFIFKKIYLSLGIECSLRTRYCLKSINKGVCLCLRITDQKPQGLGPIGQSSRGGKMFGADYMASTGQIKNGG